MGIRTLIRRPNLLAVLALVATATGCSTTVQDRMGRGVAWDVDLAEEIVWRADDPSFAQDYELEASGLAMVSGLLVLPSEKYARLLVIDATTDPDARVVRLDVPRHAELEGIAVAGSSIFLCDEAHAAVYEIRMGDNSTIADLPSESRVGARRLHLEGLEVEGGKIGFEGIEFDARTGRILLLLERSGNESDGCFSTIFPLQRDGDQLLLDGQPTRVELEDCNWRLTGLAWRQGRLIALKTQYPGERYEIIDVDLETGSTEVLLDLTTLMRGYPARGWSNNIEGIAIDGEDALWLVSDSAVTGVIDAPVPPLGEQQTLLLRIPATDRN